MPIVKRFTLEVNLRERPFKEGETLVSYARRILMEDGQPGVILDVSARVDFVDVSTYAHQDTACIREQVEIEVWMEGMVR